MHRELDRLVAQMVSSRITYADAHREFEKRFLACALQESRGSITRCAALTGLHRNTLTRKIAEHGLKT